MTVETTNSSVTAHGNDSTKIFAYDFKIFDATDLRVYIIKDATGETILKTLTTDYTVSGVGSPSGGNVTMLIAPATGETLLIKRVMSITQETAYTEGDKFPAEAHEDALDKGVMISQQLERQLGRSLQLPESATEVSNQLPLPSGGKALGWSADEKGVVNIAFVGAVGFSPLGEELVGKETAEEMRELLGTGDFNRVWGMLMGA